MKKYSNFKEVYKLPLQWDRDFSTKVFTKDYSMAFDFPSVIFRKMYPNLVTISKDNQSAIIECLNGFGKPPLTKLNLEYDPINTIIYLIDARGKKREFIIVRGWGNLTGIGGHNLKEEKAVELQTQFANYIIEKLTK